MRASARKADILVPGNKKLTVHVQLSATSSSWFCKRRSCRSRSWEVKTLRWVPAFATDVVDSTCRNSRTNRTNRTNGTDWSSRYHLKVFISERRIQELQARCPEITLSNAVAAAGPLNFLLSVLDICPKDSYIINLTRES